MILDRRAAILGLTLTAASAGAVHAAAPKPRPLIIAHRGASGERPEHTPMAYRLAVEEGADFIEPDLVVTADGHLVVRHENEIGGTTDIASRPEFASRKTTRVVDGEDITGWFTEDLTLEELKTLRCRERLPQLRPDNARYDGREAIPTFQEVVDIARAESRRTGRVIGVYPELKHPTHFARIGLPSEDRLVAALKANDLDSATAPVFVQCFEVGTLKTLRGKTRARLIQLVSAEGGPADLPGVTYADMVRPGGLKAVAAYADGLGPDWSQVLNADTAAQTLRPTALVADSHAVGLKVHPWTVRAESYFLPEWLQAHPVPVRPDQPRLHGKVQAVYQALFAAGVDGLFTDFPGLGKQARDAEAI